MLQTLPENAVDCCVTSPPYSALRDYGADGQIGREATPEEYVSRITAMCIRDRLERSLTKHEERIEVLEKMVLRLYEDMVAGRIRVKLRLRHKVSGLLYLLDS